MKTPLLTSLLCAAGLLCLRPAVFAAPVAPSPDELHQVIAAAAQVDSGQSFEPFRQLEDWVRLSVSNSVLRAQLEAGLIKLLAPDATLEARGFACKQLAVIGTGEALPALAPLLTQPDTAGYACFALTTYPPGRADETLLNALNSALGPARVQIINTLGDRRVVEAVPWLIAAAHANNRAEAEAGIAALGKVGTAQARRAIAELRPVVPAVLQRTVLEASLRCADRLAAQGDIPGATALYESLLASTEPASVRRSAFGALLRLEPNRGEERVLQALRRADGALIPVGIAAIPSLRLRDGSAPFGRELVLLEPEQQVLLLDSLAEVGDTAAFDTMVKAVDSPDPLVRRAAIAALGRGGDLSAVPVLVRSLRELEGTEDVRAVDTALVELGGGSASDDSILQAFDHSSGPLRAHLVSIVARRLGERANPLLLREANSPYQPEAVAALRALGRTATLSEVPPLLSMLADSYDSEVSAEAESAAAQAVARIQNAKERSKLVIQALDRATTIEGRCALLSLLPGCGDAPALVPLRAAALSRDPRIHDAAVRALADWPDSAAWDGLATAYHDAQKEPLRSIALRGLVRMASELNAHPDAALVARYRSLLDSAKSDAEVKLILGALAGVPLPEALDLAQAQLDRPGVKAEAEAAVKQISAGIKEKRPQAEEENAPKASSTQQ